MKTRVGIGLAAMALFGTVGLLAQTPAPGNRPRDRERLGPGRGQQEFQEMQDAYLVMLVQKQMALKDEQFARLLPLVRQLQDDRRAFAERRRKDLVELRRLFDSGNATEVQVGDLLSDLKSIEIERPAAEHKSLQAIDAVLSPVQQAQYRVVEAEVERKLGELLARTRARAFGAQPGQRRQGGARPAAAPTPKTPE